MEAKNVSGESPLLTTLIYGNYDAFDLLLDRGADVNAIDEDGDSPLHYVIKENGCIENIDRRKRLIEKLLDKGADKEAKDKHGYSPLISAIKNYFYEAVDLLLDRGADINANDEYGDSPLHYAIKYNCSIENIDRRKRLFDNSSIQNIDRRKKLVEKLLDKGADKEAKDKNGYSSLRIAVNDYFYEAVDLLLERGADINAKDEYGNSVLHYAIKYNGCIKNMDRRKRFIEKLLDKGADKEAKDKDGFLPLTIAVDYDFYEAVDLLLDRGADVNAIDEEGDSPLHYAIKYNWYNSDKRIRIMEKLLDKGADKEAEDTLCNSPLMNAVKNEFFEACYLLMDLDADVNVTGSFGDSLLHTALRLWSTTEEIGYEESQRRIIFLKRQIRLIEELLNKGADLEAKNYDGDSPLLIAVSYSNYYSCYLLLDRGADVNVKNIMGQTPLHCVQIMYFETSDDFYNCVVELLLFFGGSMLVMDNNGVTPLDKIIMDSPDDPDDCLKFLKQLRKLVIKLKPKELKMQLDRELERELEKIWALPEIAQHISTSFEDEYLTLCLKELEKMKTTMFGCHSLYYYYILYKRDDPPCVTHYELDQAIRECTLFSEDFQCYATLLMVTFSKGKRRRPLLDAAEEVVHLPLPNEIVRKVLAFLSNEELKTIIESSE